MTLYVTPFANGPWRQNCYVLGTDDGQSILVDPGSDAEHIQEMLKQQELTPLAVVNTHAHFDHIGAVRDLMEYFDIPFYLHAADAPLLRRANLYRLVFDGKTSVRIPESFEDLTDTEILDIGPFHFRVIATPGHTAGSISLEIENALFTGDMLMSNGPGRYDLPGGSKSDMQASMLIYEKLPQELTVYPGHGKPFKLAEGLAKSTLSETTEEKSA